MAVPQRWNRYAYVRNNPMRYLDPDGLTERTGWTAGTVVNRSTQTILIAGDTGGRTVVIPLDPGESSDDYLQDTDAIVVGSGQDIDGATSGAFKLGTSDTVVTGTEAYNLRIDRDMEYFLSYAAKRAGYQSREEATQNGWTEPQNMEEAREQKEELRKRRDREREEGSTETEEEPEPE